MNIRNATASDASSIAELLLIAHQLHVNAHPETYREISRQIAVDSITMRIAEKNAYFRVAEINSTLCGYCSAVIRTALNIPLFQPRTVIYINDIVVRPDHQRSGVGQALIADVKALAQHDGINEIELDVGHFNSKAKAFFTRQGFVVLRERLITRADA